MVRRLLNRQDGFTLTELLIAVAIIAIVALIVILMNWRIQIDRAYDARRKADLEKIRISLEEYYNDKSCYPASGSFDQCGGATLAPYLAKILCDPQTSKPYLYIPDTDPCTGYHACVTLKDKGDPDIARLGCDPDLGCGWGAGYNYCIAAGSPITAAGFSLGGGGGPTPTPTGGQYQGQFACTPGGQCNSYADPQGQGCPVSWQNDCPPGACNNPANRCLN